MKLNLLIPFVFILSFYFGQAGSNEQQTNNARTIAEYEEDITGDGFNELIELKGVLLTNNSDFYRDLWVDITSKQNNSWKIPYISGYEPELQFITLPNNKGKYIFFGSTQPDNLSDQTSFLHTLSNDKIIEVDLPTSYFMKGSFQNGFIIQLSIHDQLNPIVLPIKNKERYEKLYTNDGVLRNPTNVYTKKDASYSPTYISETKQFGLTGMQQIYKSETTELIGVIETLWYYEHDKWIRIKEQLK